MTDLALQFPSKWKSIVDPLNAERDLDVLIAQRKQLLRRIEVGRSGVVELRARLKIVTHEIIRMELAG